MEFIYGKHDWKDMERGQENCYLLTNGLGGYSSLTMLGSCARNDHAFFMAAIKAPALRYHMISKIEEAVCCGNTSYVLSAQEYVDFTRNEKGFLYLNGFSKDIFPVWNYQAGAVELQKSIVMKNGKNIIGVQYKVRNRSKEEAALVCTPWMQFVPKGEKPEMGQTFLFEKETEKCFGEGKADKVFSGEEAVISSGTVKSNGMKLFFRTNGEIYGFNTKWKEDYYYAQDARDGRAATGRAAANHEVRFTVSGQTEQTFFLIYSMEPFSDTIEKMFSDEEKRQLAFIHQAGIRDAVGQQLVKSGDCFLADRESTGEKTILAGYPFFADWGRDTMIAVYGIGIASGRYEETKSIFRSFCRYIRKGLMPNMFPESGEEPIYNTVDAALLFINAVYEYYHASKQRGILTEEAVQTAAEGDLAFIREVWGPMCEIVSWYQRGTDFHIHMDTDGLLMAGERLEQVTWMDVRFGDILPTPRHGKPVEVNVWWYNALKIMEEFSALLQEDNSGYGVLAERVKESFQQKFWNEKTGCLKDTVSGENYDEQIRCNQIWAVSAPYSILTKEQEEKVVEAVFEKLYTPYGLRTLCAEDAQFHAVYGGSQFERDMAYHQGTVWPFPMGAYYLAYLKVHGYSEAAKRIVREQLKTMEAVLREGCIGQIAEVYDGGSPDISKGCFAQAWSVGELLRVYRKLEE